MSTDFYKSREAVKQYIELAKDVSGAELIEQLKKHLSADASLLELGSGPGTDWEILNKYYNVTGSDYSEEFIAHLQERHPAGTFYQLDAITLDTDQKFDGLYSNKVLHLFEDGELKRSVQNQIKLLHPAGIICHSFWKGEGEDTYEGMLANYHTVENIERFFGNHFETLVMHTYAEFEEGDSLLYIGKLK